MHLNRVKSIIAAACLIYAVFFLGYSFGLSQVEQMLNYQAELSSTKIKFSGGFNVRNYIDMSMKFCFISVCYFLFLLISRINKRILFEIGALILILLAIYQKVIFIFYTAPGYLPGQHTPYPMFLINTLLYLDFLFLGAGIILSILQFAAIWQSYKDNYSTQNSINNCREII